MLTNLLIIFLLLCTGSLYAWDEEGHMLIAQVAYTQLDTATLSKIDTLINVMSNEYPDYSDRLSVAVWADYIKKIHNYTFDSWHYIDTPYNPENLNVPPIDPNNIVWAIGQASNVLHSFQNSFREINSDPSRHHTTNVGGMDITTSNDLTQRAFMLRILIHLVGDLHQPFHNINFWSSAHPNGDRGGNSFHISGGGRRTSLHAFWDAGANEFGTIYKFPLSGQEKTNIENVANQLIEKYPKVVVDSIDLSGWSTDGHNLAITDGYIPIMTSHTITDDYTTHAKQVCEQQIVTGGYRLAYILQSVLAN